MTSFRSSFIEVSVETRARRRSARRSRRGAALVEALVVIPTFIILFASILFIGSLYRAKLRAMRLSREGAWSYAMADCGEPGDAMTTRYTRGAEVPAAGVHDEGRAEPDGADLGEATAHTRGAPQSSMASKSFGSAEATATTEVAASGAIGGFSRQMRSRTRVMCNEAPFDGDLRGFMNAAKDAFTRW
jgi:hypothetical protein